MRKPAVQKNPNTKERVIGLSNRGDRGTYQPFFSTQINIIEAPHTTENW